jgi:membrane-bound serine protease (ClpP class)
MQYPVAAILAGLLATVAAVFPAGASGATADSAAAAERTGSVYIASVDGAIGPATKDYLHRVLVEAAGAGAACTVILMDTPGGLSASMRDIIKDILASPVPIVVYVSPSGARAASAGALIALAAHVAAMAPGTNIGAAHPVSIGAGGEKDETMEEKITNDAAAYARSLASQRGRNIEWAEKVVRESISSTAEEALAEDVIDVVAPGLDDLLAAIDGRVVETVAGSVAIRTAGAERVEAAPSARERFLARISDPNIAYLLMLIGVFGIIFEFQNPGALFPGILGVIALITAAFALQMLPVNLTGLTLIALAIVLFLLEIKVPSHGALTLGGVVSMVIGSVMLIDSPLPFMKVSLSVIVPSVVFTALFFLFAVGVGLRAQRRKVSTGASGLVGEAGVARDDVHDQGTVFVHGEYWNAWSDEPIPSGTRVTVLEVDGMKLKVTAAVRGKEVS